MKSGAMGGVVRLRRGITARWSCARAEGVPGCTCLGVVQSETAMGNSDIGRRRKPRGPSHRRGADCYRTTVSFRVRVTSSVVRRTK